MTASQSPHDSVMTELKSKLSALNDVIEIGKPLVYVDYPVHFNVGDLLIWAGTEAFFKAYNHKVLGSYAMIDLCRAAPDGYRLKKDIVHIDKLLSGGATLVIHGGGNIGDLYPDYQAFKELLITRYKKNRIVILPQTVYFKDAANRARAAKCMASHPDLHLNVRDYASMPFLEEAKAKGGILPDMAHQLWNTDHYPTPLLNEETFIRLCRTDDESKGDINKHGQVFDWKDLRSLTDRFALRFIHKWQSYDMPPALSFPCYHLWHPFSTGMINKARKLLTQYNTFYTDRLHGMIMGALLGRRVFAYDNNYGKISNYYHTWLAASDKLALAET